MSIDCVNYNNFCVLIFHFEEFPQGGWTGESRTKCLDLQFLFKTWLFHLPSPNYD